jgi:hypothetical protein
MGYHFNAIFHTNFANWPRRTPEETPIQSKFSPNIGVFFRSRILYPFELLRDYGRMPHSSASLSLSLSRARALSCMLEPVRPGAVSPERPLGSPTFSHFLIVSKTSPLLSPKTRAIAPASAREEVIPWPSFAKGEKKCRKYPCPSSVASPLPSALP